jgi:peptidoglycan-N-acetylglucosamine deacetylase
VSDQPFRVALTIDTEHPDRPGADPTASELLEQIERAHIRATFFVQGRWASAHPGQTLRIAAAGHLIGNHSHHHAPLPSLTDGGIAEDVSEARDAISAATGGESRPWFRCPFGAGEDDPRVLAVLDGLGYRNCRWDVDPEDWRPGNTERAIVETVIEGVARHGDGAVVLLHSWPTVTARALPSLIDALRTLGATPVALDEVVAS